MKFNKGLNEKIFDFESEYGKLYFLSLRATPLENDDNGELSKVRKRVYNLLSENKRAVIQVSLPAEVEEKTFSRNQEIKLINPVLNVMAVTKFPDVDIVEYVTSDDIVAVGSSAKTNSSVNINKKSV